MSLEVQRRAQKYRALLQDHPAPVHLTKSQSGLRLLLLGIPEQGNLTKSQLHLGATSVVARLMSPLDLENQVKNPQLLLTMSLEFPHLAPQLTVHLQDHTPQVHPAKE